jgi:hypothetical protein
MRDNRIEPSLECFETALKARVARLEVWQDLDNREVFNRLAKDKCPGVPFLFNLKTQGYACGALSCEELKAKLL